MHGKWISNTFYLDAGGLHVTNGRIALLVPLLGEPELAAKVIFSSEQKPVRWERNLYLLGPEQQIHLLEGSIFMIAVEFE